MAYKSILSAFANKEHPDETLLLQPPARFGELASDAAVLTARAIMMELSQIDRKSKQFTVTLCVAGDPRVVASYDRALQMCFRTQMVVQYWAPPTSLSWVPDAEHFWRECAQLSTLGAHYGPYRVALIIGCKEQPGISLLAPNGMVDAANNEAERCVFRWLQIERPKTEPETESGATELFRATIAGASEDTVFVHCDKSPYWLTLVFARFDSSRLESTQSSLRDAYSAIIHNGQKLNGAYVSQSSFNVEPTFLSSINLKEIKGQVAKKYKIQ